MFKNSEIRISQEFDFVKYLLLQKYISTILSFTHDFVYFYPLTLHPCAQDVYLYMDVLQISQNRAY